MKHRLEHFFKGVCICHCKDCSVHVGTGRKTVCICPKCPADKCGLKEVKK